MRDVAILFLVVVVFGMFSGCEKRAQAKLTDEQCAALRNEAYHLRTLRAREDKLREQKMRLEEIRVAKALEWEEKEQ